MHLVGFTIEIYYDARSYKRQICINTLPIRRVLSIKNSKTINASLYCTTPLTGIANYPDRLSPSCKFVENSIKLTCLEITGYRIKYNTVLWLLELQIRRGRKV